MNKTGLDRARLAMWIFNDDGPPKLLKVRAYTAKDTTSRQAGAMRVMLSAMLEVIDEFERETGMDITGATLKAGRAKAVRRERVR